LSAQENAQEILDALNFILEELNTSNSKGKTLNSMQRVVALGKTVNPDEIYIGDHVRNLDSSLEGTVSGIKNEVLVIMPDFSKNITCCWEKNKVIKIK
jgi:hypothetical protein